MLNKAHWVLLTMVWLIVLSTQVGCTRPYFSHAIEGVVLDAATKVPLAGVSVVAHWPVNGGLEGGNFEGNLNLIETETDNSGKFHFPSWGPKWSGGTVRHSTPHLIFFKREYKTETKMNIDTGTREWAGPMSSDWNGKTIDLERMERSNAQYMEGLEFLSDRLIYIGRNRFGRCDWENLARVIVSIEREYRLLKKAGIIAPGKESVHGKLVGNDAAITRDCSGAPTDLLRLGAIRDKFAEYAVNQIIDGIDRLYFIHMLLDADGVWRIDSM